MRSYALLGLIAVAAWTPACSVQFGGEESSTPPPVVATPTPVPQTTPTAVPTPTAIPTPVPTPTVYPPNGYRVSRWSLSDVAGVDQNDDGQVDNAYIPVYDASIQVISNQVFNASYDLLVETGIPIQQARLIALQFQQSVLDYYSVETFNVFMARAIAASRFNIVQNLASSPAAIEWMWAEPGDLGSWSVTTDLGVQESLGGMWGPAILRFDFGTIYGSSAESQLLVLGGTPELAVSDAWSIFTETIDGLRDAELGGVVWREDMRDYILALVPISVCAPAGDPCIDLDIAAPTEEALDEMYTELEASGAWTVSGGGDIGVTVGFSWGSDPAAIR